MSSLPFEHLGDDVTLLRGDARLLLKALVSEQVDAVITSPPYADVRDDYEGATPSEFAEWLTPFMVEIRRLLRPGGGFLLNLGRKFKDGAESSYAERTLLRAEDLGFHRVDTIVWGKINPRPVPPYLTNAHETVYWLTTGNPAKAYRGLEEVRYPYATESMLRYQRPWTNHANRKETERKTEPVQRRRKLNAQGARPRSLFVTEIGKQKGIKHPAPMALDFARFLVCVGSPAQVCEFHGPMLHASLNGLLPGGGLCKCSHTRWRPSVVLDPFAGSGTTGLAARLHGRHALLIEQEDEYADELAERLRQTALAV